MPVWLGFPSGDPPEVTDLDVEAVIVSEAMMGVKTHCWLKRMQLPQRPSAELSKPEHLIFLRRQYLHATAVR